MSANVPGVGLSPARLLHFRKSESWETVVCGVLVCFVELGLRLLRLPTLTRLLGVRLSAAELPSAPPALMPRWTQRCLNAADRVTARWPAGPEGKCLRRALVAGHRLRSLQPEVVIGIRPGDNGLRAHAWLVVCGGALDPSAGDFSQIPVFRP